MFRMNSIAMSMVLLAAFSARASEDSYFDILKSMFRSANQNISADDFNVVGDPDAKICLEIVSALPNSENLVHLRRFTFIKDGNGPALPEMRFTRIVFSSVTEPDIRGILEKVNTSFSDRQIVSNHLAPYNFEIKVRKTAEGYLSFSRATDGKIISYGYCY